MTYLAPYSGRWDNLHAAHLLNRTGFGALPEEIEQVTSWGMQRSVDYLVDFDKIPEPFDEPETPDPPEGGKRLLNSLPEEERKKIVKDFQQSNREAIEDIRGWWIRRMRTTKRPLQEKLTLFWHGHFATSANDVKSARHMLMQNEFLRKNCLGNFRDLLLGISRDPAMLKYLDNNTNRKEHPNENYARELMELFSMGIGNYSENDVKEAARAFTGWTFHGDEFVLVENQHDDGTKHFLDTHGLLDGTDVIDTILRQPSTARFMAKKLFAYFVYDDPEPAVVDEWAALLRKQHYEFKPFLRTLFSSEVFYSPKAYRTQIKSPAQLVVGSARLLGVTANDRALAVAMRMIGQDLLFPPNVKGWDGGEAWINTNSLLLRYNLARYLVSGKIPTEGDMQVAGTPKERRQRLSRYAEPENSIANIISPQLASDAPLLVDTLVWRLMQARMEAVARLWLVQQAEVVRVHERATVVAHLIMSMPDYQLC